MAQRNWEKFSVAGGRGGEEAGEVERGLSLQGFGLIFWNLCFILREQTELSRHLHLNLLHWVLICIAITPKQTLKKKNENRSLWQASG